MINRILLGGCAAAALACVLAVVAAPAAAQDPNYAAIKPNEVKWSPFDPKQPNGIQVAVLAGDPQKKGTFVMRAKFPSGSEVASHHHTTAEYCSILSGRLLIAFGVKPDKSKAMELGPGGFFWLKGGEHHHVWVPEETIIDFSAEGPFDIMFD